MEMEIDIQIDRGGSERKSARKGGRERERENERYINLVIVI